MSDDLKKFFDPKTVSVDNYRTVPLDYFEKVRHKLKLAFALSDNPLKLYQWDDPEAQRSLLEYKANGGSEILIDREKYDLKIKELAES